MSVRIGCGLSENADARAGALEAAAAARDGLGGAAADIALVFAAGAHLAAPEATLEGVHEGLAPEQLAGCGAGGVLARGHEVESGTACAVWAAAVPDGVVEAFHTLAVEVPEGVTIEGFPVLDQSSALLLLADPYTFPIEGALEAVHSSAPGMPVVGGLVSGRTPSGEGALLLNDEVLAEGAIGVRFEGVEVLPCVSQGAAPFGPELTVTASDGNVIHELAGRPALETLRDVVGSLGSREAALVAGGLLLGIVVDGNKPSYERGDFLVRGLIGVDPETGSLAVGAPVEVGQVVRLHARDAASADEDLRQALALHREALGGRPPAGALVFTCNGRGRGMFGAPDHDAGAIGAELAGAPAAGFFAAGEIGPVGGETFVHGFTATLAVFPR